MTAISKIPIQSDSRRTNQDARDLTIRIGFDGAEEKRRVLDWLGSGLRPDRPGRLQQEYPLLFRRNASVFHLTLYDGFTPVAFASLWAVNFRVGVTGLRVGMLSLVYTDPKARNRGHATHIVRAAIEHARNLRLGLVLLWSDLAALYTGLGFARAGLETLIHIDRPTLSRALAEAAPADANMDVFQIQEATWGDWTAIERIRNDRDSQLELDAGEITRLRSIPNMSIRVAKRGDKVLAFAIRGRGDDLAEVIHEWGGEPTAVLRCCDALVADAEPESELLLLSPNRRSDVTWWLRRAGARVIQKSVAWIRIANAEAFAKDISRMLPDDANLQMMNWDADPDRGHSENRSLIELRSSGGVVKTDQSTLFNLLFDAPVNLKIGQRSEADCAELLGDSIMNALPLPFFIWGLESI